MSHIAWVKIQGFFLTNLQPRNCQDRMDCSTCVKYILSCFNKIFLSIFLFPPRSFFCCGQFVVHPKRGPGAFATLQPQWIPVAQSTVAFCVVIAMVQVSKATHSHYVVEWLAAAT
jgi:hypothetical protein